MDIAVKHIALQQFFTPVRVENYCVFIFRGEGTIAVDTVPYSYEGNTLLFLSPYQYFQWVEGTANDNLLLEFHGDFYCIEYHKKEVACNGLLFNTIFLHPHIKVTDKRFAEIITLFERIGDESKTPSLYSESVLKSYLQLILALASKEKSLLLEHTSLKTEHHLANDFQKLLEDHFITERNVSFYASALCLTPDSFSKKIKTLLGKTPNKLIQERVVLEAKKLLHLTYKSIKEVAFELNFEDEFYFSRFFKKNVGLSPKHFRKKVGISIVAQPKTEKSMK